jgi:hypothetical protein
MVSVKDYKPDAIFFLPMHLLLRRIDFIKSIYRNAIDFGLARFFAQYSMGDIQSFAFDEIASMAHPSFSPPKITSSQAMFIPWLAI